MQKLKITVLNDNTAGRWCRAEHGLSYMIEADFTVLFDTSSSDLIAYNAKILNIDLQQIGTIVLSHGHDDHTGGLSLFEGQQLVCHPDTFLKRTRKSNGTELGIKWSEDEIRSEFDLVLSRDPIQLSGQIYFLGEIPRLTEFESKTTAFEKADGTDDFVLDDSGLAIVTSKGLVVISGCAHSGICNMTAHAMKVTGIEKVYLVIGGFHLQSDDATTQKTIDWMKSMQVEQVIPSHCTSFSAQAAISKSFRFVPVKSGNTIEIG
ncbi:7,8 dihydropteroate synthase [Aquipluma nitroreducens]|uniref:7,8 dihydropteroate synthase n=1 Tax=Aquipluma nitroreducens TaxID=2010828 RepID=A0A5K7SBH8_9BACT|nr:MBL fold metallo-hydrolase [Aquipluma nitroreducens]BBE18928.1 7,8 dihydropteroate synthase [Aquipluma nitroreducens]